VKPAPFAHVRPATVAEAVQALAAGAALDGGAKVLAGGQSLAPLLAMRLSAPSLLVDLNALPGLRGVATDGPDGVRIGALTRHADFLLPADGLVGGFGGAAGGAWRTGVGDRPVLGAEGTAGDVRRTEIEWVRAGAPAGGPLLAEAAGWIGHTAIRARGTFGGSLAHADPNAEWPAVALACDAELTVVGPGDVRAVPATGFFHGLLQTDLADDELLTSVRLARPRAWAFTELARRHGDFALVLCVVTELSAGWRVVLGGVAGTPVRCPSAEALLDAGERSPAAVAAAVAAAPEAEAFSDLHASAAYRRAMAAELTARALRQLRPDAPPHGPPAGGPPAPAGVAPGPPPDATAVGRLVPPRREAAPPPSAERSGAVAVTLNVNGRRRAAACEPRHTLADVLREQLGLTGTHLGCEQGVCGACTVLLDGEPVRSCLTFAVQVEGTVITTIEGLAAPDGTLHPVQDAFSRCHGLQCGYCTPGFVLTAVHLLTTDPAPPRPAIREALSGNLCRCTGYVGIVDAVELAATEAAAGGIVGAADHG